MEVGVWLQFAELMREIRAQGLSKIIPEASLFKATETEGLHRRWVVFIGGFRGGDMAGVTFRVRRCLGVIPSPSRKSSGNLGNLLRKSDLTCKSLRRSCAGQARWECTVPWPDSVEAAS